MGIFDYEVIQIDGDYAHLRNLDRPEDGLKLVARALLPQEIQEGSRLHYECFADSSGIRAWTSGPGVCAVVFSSVNPADMPKIPGFSSAESGENP